MRAIQEALLSPVGTADAAGRRTTAALWRLLPFVVYGLLVLITWKRWVLPFQDSGRELLTAARLASGEVLYRDVGSPYGPLPAYLDALALRLFGRNLDVLIGLRILVGLFGVEALRRLAGRLARDAHVGSAIASFIVAACLFGVGGNWPFPYSVAALEGTVGTWWAVELALRSRGRTASLVSAVVAGLAAGTKLEMLPTAILGLGAALAGRRPRREAASAVAVALLLGVGAFALPVILFGPDVVHRYGFLIAFPLPKAWKRMYEAGCLFAGTSPERFFRGEFFAVWAPSILFFGLVVLLCSVPASAIVRAAALLTLVGLNLPLIQRLGEVNGLLPFSLVVLIGDAVPFLRRRFLPPDPRFERLCVALVALPALARQPFFLRNLIYGAFSAPLALAVSLGWIGSRIRHRRSFAAVLLGLAAIHVSGTMDEVRARPMSWLDVPGIRVFLPREEAAFVREAIGTLERNTPPGGYVAIFPDPGFLLFSTSRRSPFVDDVFYPGCQDAKAEAAMIRRLSEAPVSAVLVTNRPFGEYGRETYGKGVLDRFFGEVGRTYSRAIRIGRPPREHWTERHATMGVLYLPGTDAPPESR